MLNIVRITVAPAKANIKIVDVKEFTRELTDEACICNLGKTMTCRYLFR
jgi:hypothetical protein